VQAINAIYTWTPLQYESVNKYRKYKLIKQ
jgi:hypothetical protein